LTNGLLLLQLEYNDLIWQMEGSLMQACRTYLYLFFAFSSIPCAFAMMPEADRDPMEIDEPAHDNRPDRIATLKQMCLKYTASHLPAFVKNQKISSLNPDLQGEIHDLWMFGENSAEMHRNPAITWLMAQCPVIKCRPCQFDRSQLARPLIECNNMRIYTAKRSDGFIAHVEDVQAQKPLLEFISEDPLAYAQFSPDGCYIFLAAIDKQIAIMSTKDMEVIHEGELQCKWMFPRFISLSPKNSAVICGSGCMLRLHDTITGDFFCDVVRGAESIITEVGFSADGDRVFVRYDIEEENGDENLQDLSNIPTQPGIVADVYDISVANKILHLLPTLTLEQLAALELCHKVATEKASEEQLAHATEQYKVLPEEIRAVLARFLPGMAQETALKRRKVDGSANLE
jgi:hypothetical protein